METWGLRYGANLYPEAWGSGANPHSETWGSGANPHPELWDSRANPHPEAWGSRANPHCEAWGTGANPHPEAWGTGAYPERLSPIRCCISSLHPLGGITPLIQVEWQPETSPYSPGDRVALTLGESHLPRVTNTVFSLALLKAVVTYLLQVFAELNRGRGTQCFFTFSFMGL